MSEVVTASVPLDGGPKSQEGATPPAGGGVPADGGTPPNDTGNGAPAAGGTPAGDPPKSDAAPVNPNELTKPEPKSPEQVEAEKATGLDLTPFTQEWHQNGGLSEESYKALEEKGFTREITDTYIEGVRAKAQMHLTNVASAVGGVDNYNAILEWGKTALSDTEKHETVKMLSGNPETAKTYLQGLQARYVQSHGKAPGKIAGGGGAPQEEVYASRAEQAKAMKDPRYKTDAGYRNEVLQKSIRSFGKGSKGRAKKKTTATRRRSKTTSRRAPKGKR